MAEEDLDDEVVGGGAEIYCEGGRCTGEAVHEMNDQSRSDMKEL